MDKSRLILALALSLMVLMSWPLIMHYVAPQPPDEPLPAEAFEPTPPPPPADQKRAVPAKKEATPPAPSPAPPQSTQAAQREITISSEYWSATISNHGAVATSWILRKFEESGVVREIKAADGGELQLIPQEIPDKLDPPLSLHTPMSPEVGRQLRDVNFQVSGVGPGENNIDLHKGDYREITFTYTSPTVTATKTFAFRGDRFVFDVKADVTSGSGQQPVELVLGPRFGDQSDKQSGSYSTPPQVIAYTRDGHREAVPGARITAPFASITSVDHSSNQIEIDKPLAGDIAEIKIVAEKGAQLVGVARVVNREPNGKRLTLDSLPAGTATGLGVAQGADTLRKSYSWAGVTDHYFAFLAVPKESSTIPEITLTNLQVKHDGTPLDYPSAAVPVGSGLHIFVGPKDLDLLAEVGTDLGANLGALIDYGMFSFAVRPLIPALAWSLKWLWKMTGNFGWAIVMVTVAINLALSPLRFYSSKKMKKAAKHQPRMKELQERMKKLKENPKKYEREMQQLQQEQMALMKEANPLGGCLPMILQLPIFWAVYLYLGSSLDVRHAPWILWLQDLSRPDPYKILPIVMCVTMIASTKLTPQPASADPSMKMQRVMMTWLMPIMLTWLFFISAPSGLVLYWMVSNVVGVLIQLWINRRTADLTADAAGAAAITGSGKGPARVEKAGGKGANGKSGKRRSERRGGGDEKVSEVT
ncbi:MAG TPA: YidC/Oxa1 family insertase periplasmic-domain containing protein [Blastocatellia bacterium]|nr:YidC/Oxa1 family insertase periplasmic-domain containing protein [Blastocatellia bacterium]